MKFISWVFVVIIGLQAGCSKNATPAIVNNVSNISISPSSGPAGTTVIIRGANFGASVSDNLVKFNNDSAAVLFASDDSLVVIAPSNGTTGHVTVTVDGITATGPVYSYIIDSIDIYAVAPASGVEYWKNGEEIFLEPTQINSGGAYGLAVSDTDVYIGSYTNYNQTFTAAYWKNRQKIILSSPDSEGEVRALVLSGGDLMWEEAKIPILFIGKTV